MSTGAPRRRGRGEKTQSADQFHDAGVEEILRLAKAANVRSLARRRQRFRRRAFAVLAVVLVLCAVAAYRVAFGAGSGQESTRPGVLPSSAPAVGTGAGTRSIPDFVWVAAKGAVHYRVEFLLGARVVHTADTNVPRLHVTAASLPPGRYRWRVWAVDRSGARVGRAVVDASVTIR